MQNYKTPRRLIRQEKSLDNHDYGNDILDMASKGQSMKKNQQLDFIKIKNVGSAKGTVKKLRKKKKPQTAGKYLEKHISVKGLLSKIYKKPLKFNNKKTNILN